MSYNSFVYDLSEEFTYKEEIDPISIVHFRTIPGSYDCSFGFDWLRVDEPMAKEPAYKDIIEGGYKSPSSDLTKEEAYKKLETEYERGKISYKDFSKKEGKQNKYYSPYLSIFSKEYSDTIKVSPAPTYKARLAVLVENSADIDGFKFEYDETLFAMDDSQFQQICWETQQIAAGSIEITCLKDFNKKQFIDIYAQRKMPELECVGSTLAGRIVVVPNSEKYRKEEKFVLVKVRTDIFNKRKDVEGRFWPEEQIKLRNFCYQALVCPQILDDVTLDLTQDLNFKTGGKFIVGKNIKTTPAMMKYIKERFREIPSNSMYNDYFPIFSFGFEDKYIAGRAEAVGVKNVIIFEGRRNETVAHEVFHGFNLYHTHRGNTPLEHPNIKYIYPKGDKEKAKSENATDNIMSYNLALRLTTWKWQWDIIRSNI